jgi:hypothetical protein
VDPEQLHIVKKTSRSLLKDSFAKASKINTTKLEMHKEEVLRNAVDQKVALEAFVKLVTVCNLLYNYSQWPKLYAFITAINYTAEDLINLSHSLVQKLCANLYSIYKDILRKKL